MMIYAARDALDVLEKRAVIMYNKSAVREVCT